MISTSQSRFESTSHLHEVELFSDIIEYKFHRASTNVTHSFSRSNSLLVQFTSSLRRQTWRRSLTLVHQALIIRYWYAAHLFNDFLVSPLN
jgi:hypothetical protein